MIDGKVFLGPKLFSSCFFFCRIEMFFSIVFFVVYDDNITNEILFGFLQQQLNNQVDHKYICRCCDCYSKFFFFFPFTSFEVYSTNLFIFKTSVVVLVILLTFLCKVLCHSCSFRSLSPNLMAHFLDQLLKKYFRYFFCLLLLFLLGDLFLVGLFSQQGKEEEMTKNRLNKTDQQNKKSFVAV